MSAARLLALAGASLVAATAAATAQTVDGNAALAYRGGTFDGDGYDAWTLAASADAAFGDRVGLDLSGAFTRFLDDDSDAELDVAQIQAIPTYRVAGGLKAGGYLARLDLGDDTADAAVESYGIVLGFETPRSDLYGFVGHSRLDPELDADVTDYGYNARYDVNGAFSLAGGWARTNIADDGSEADLDTISMAGLYGTGPWAVYGGFVRYASDVDGFAGAEGTSVSLGGSYEIGMRGSAAATVTGELVSTDFEHGLSETAEESFSLGVSIPFGAGAGRGAPAGTQANEAFDGRLTALNRQFLLSF